MPQQSHSTPISDLEPLGDPDGNGLRLPPGFTSRIIARSGQPVAPTGYVWHPAPDGGAAFPLEDGGWIYVSNCERKSDKGGGASAIRFDLQANIVDAYRILEGTRMNCAGGATPWGTWLSCEEFDEGQVWECEITRQQAKARPALGVFKHEAVAVDPVHKQLFLTEDRRRGGFYRFTSENSAENGALDLSSGKLEIAQVIGAGKVVWHPIPDPQAASGDTRKQVPESTKFKGGEGIYYYQGTVYFATKRDNRIWAYDTDGEYISVFYEYGFFDEGELKGVDNITVSSAGDVLVAEEGDNMQIVAITQDRRLVPIVQVVGHDRSEVTGPAFDPSKTRLYFSSQRGATGDSDDGITFEVTGPFLK